MMRPEVMGIRTLVLGKVLQLPATVSSESKKRQTGKTLLRFLRVCPAPRLSTPGTALELGDTKQDTILVLKERSVQQGRTWEHQ